MTIKSFVIQSLKGFYERLPLKKIIFNGKYENPDNTGTVYLNSGFISGSGLHSAQLTGIDGEAIGSYSVSEGPLSIGYCSHSEGKTYKRTETVNISNGDFVCFNLNIGETVLYDGNYYFVIEKNDNTGVIGFDESIVLNSNITAIEVKVIFGCAIGQYSHAEGYSNASSDYSHSEGNGTEASGKCSHSEGEGTVASGDYSHAEGGSTVASGDYSHAEGGSTEASGECSHSEGEGTVASGNGSHAEGESTVASGVSSHAEGKETFAIGDASHAEGLIDIRVISNDIAPVFELCSAVNDNEYQFKGGIPETGQWIICNGNIAYVISIHKTFVSLSKDIGYINDFTPAYPVPGSIGVASHSEGQTTISSGIGSHAEGRTTISSGDFSHAEGLHTQAMGDCSHAEGYYTMALKGSHAEGVGTVAQNDGEHAQGLYNVSHVLQDNYTIHSTGIGYFDNKTNYEYRKNAFEILDNGDIFAYNVGGFDGINIENINSLQNVINNIYDRPVLPSYSSADAGKILSINALGQLEWITPIYIYTGSNAPSNSVGNNGDIYMQS